MARKSGSYKFEKRRRELEKKKKKAEKHARKQGRDGESDEPEPSELSPLERFFPGLQTDPPEGS